MAQGEMNFIELPIGKQGTGQPTILPTINIPLPKNTDPVNIEIQHETDEQTIGPSTAQTLEWHDSVGDIRALGTAVLEPTEVASITVESSPFNYDSAPDVTIEDPEIGNDTATATAVLGGAGDVIAINIDNPGSGYTSRPIVRVDPPGKFNTTVRAAAVLEPTTVVSVTITEVGSGYSSVPTVTFTSSSGVNAAGTAVLLGDVVVSVTMTNNGTGYTEEPTVTFSAPLGIEALIRETVPSQTLCMILFDGKTAIASGDIEIYATVTENLVDDVTDELLYVSHDALTAGEFLYPSTPIWLPIDKFLTINNVSVTNTITVNRIQTILFSKYP